MSGPIVRKYGFPNFEKIFGKREAQHGTDDSAVPEDEKLADATGSASSQDEQGGPAGDSRSTQVQGSKGQGAW